MDIQTLKLLANNGSVWAIERLKVLESQTPKPEAQMTNAISNNPMENNNKVTQETKGKIVSFRCPQDLLEGLYQQRGVNCRTLSSMIKQAIAEWIYWTEKLNQLKLEELNRKAKGYA